MTRSGGCVPNSRSELPTRTSSSSLERRPRENHPAKQRSPGKRAERLPRQSTPEAPAARRGTARRAVVRPPECRRTAADALVQTRTNPQNPRVRNLSQEARKVARPAQHPVIRARTFKRMNVTAPPFGGAALLPIPERSVRFSPAQLHAITPHCCLSRTRFRWSL